MKPIRVTAVYFSPTQTSKAGAEAIAQAILPQADSIDLTRFDAPLPPAFGTEDLVVFGAPVYAGRLYEGFAARLAKLRGQNTPCIITVTYGNRDYDDALLEMSDLVQAGGFVPFAAAALVAQHTYGQIQVGRPNAADLEQDHTFAAKAAARLASDAPLSPIAVPGNRPYRDGGHRGSFRPLTDPEKCVNCGRCARECPQGAIDPQDVSRIDDNTCLACFRCIRICPTGAKNMDVPQYQAFAQDFSQKLAKRRENEYFL
ncbi:MAG: 4Fe-4S binding protein [Butyricicoccus sp.]|nr:4Fe-4S binding protein [Butyricicoccus sp.]